MKIAVVIQTILCRAVFVIQFQAVAAIWRETID
jgi:hypothetical protein